MYNSNRDKRLTEQELIERQKRRDSVAMRQQHRKRKDEAKEEDSWEQLKSFNNGEDDEA